jgi:hypothetical protein
VLSGGVGEHRIRRVAGRVLMALVLVAVAACSPAADAAGTVATVDGVAIEQRALDQLHPPGAEVDAERRASSVLLLILHRLLVRSAEEQFGVSVAPEAQQAAFDTRTEGLGSDVDAALRDQGVTRDRVLLEAELDVIRERVQGRLVRAAAPEHVDAAYRTFLSVNSRVCLSALRVIDDAALVEIEDLVHTGADIAGVEEADPDAVERVDLECTSPTQLGPGLASVALDGEVGDVHVVRAEGGPYVAAVDERDAPPLEDVREEVLQIATETRGPDLFTTWAADIVRDADVEVADAIGRWAPAAGTNGLPTVVVD